MRVHRRTTKQLTVTVAAVIAAGALVTGVSASSAGGASSSSIQVGAISSLTGPIAADFDGFGPGLQAYFDMVNAQGGVNGHKLILAANLDDGGSPTQFTQLTHTLLNQDHV